MTEKKTGTGFGIKLKNLRATNPELVERIESHFDQDLSEWTPGEIQHMDVAYGQADPRVEAGNKSRGDFTARGGRGPRRR